jgi:putative ABC transport system permease protein
MIVRFVRDSLGRSPGRKAAIVAAIALGSAVATSMLGVMLSIGDKINRELRQAGANIAVTTRASSLEGGVGELTTGAAGAGDYIREDDVPRIKHIFWGLNVLGFAPSLAARSGTIPVEGVWFSHPYKLPDGRTDYTGVKKVNPAWLLAKGRWAVDVPNDAMVGAAVARRNGWKPGETISVLGAQFRIAGVISAGDETDDRVLLPLARVQALTQRPGLVDRVDVAALTTPENEFARKDPRAMTPKELERWNCTAYVSSIAHQIEGALPGTEARPVRRVADSEGKILDHVSGLMMLITLAALISAGLTVWSLTATSMMERRGEIAIMQAIGGARWMVATMLGIEIALIGMVGGIVGALIGVELARLVGESVFHDAVEISPVLPGVIMAAAIVVALVGAWQPLRHTLRMDPAVILREGV